MTAIYTAFFTYVIITSITPGPNNILSLSIAT
ncbi:amino acid transporter, partial [Vibrio parahaemolyticus]|nr:amino acid transporter [Vibrio parahaemolyticus]